MARDNSKIFARRRTVDRFAIILLGAFAILAVATALVAFFWAKNVFASWNLTQIAAPTQVSPDQMAATQQAGPPPSLPSNSPKDPLQASPDGPAAQPWDGKTRVTLLFMGLDYRACDNLEKFSECDTSKASRTDSMMLVTIDPVSKTAGMLSIPRDLWVNIPGFDYAKINTAYFLGEVNKMPGGGPALAMQTVQELLGVPIQYYAQIDFNAFVKMIDTMGGLDMYIHERIKVGAIGKPSFYIEPGVQTLNGETVLGYARNRYTEGGDFDRAKRQQEVILAIRQQVLQFNMLPTLVAKAPELYKEVQDGVSTNLTLQQAIQLAWLMQQIPEENIHKEVIGPPTDIEFGQSADGQSIDIPVPDQIRLKRDAIFTTGGPVGPAAETNNSNDLISQEKAKVVVKNGSPNDGLAAKTAEYLRAKGVNVVEEGNADQAYSQSTVIDYSGKPYTIKLLTDMLGIDNSRVLSRYDPNSTVDVEVILGSTFAQNNPLDK
jgi:polyisoprenyl-teichoic acid--peptidoglycan teichoic acid transferase